jgi:hypothetical protein
MMQLQTGKFFHIDFGHFLGAGKYFFLLGKKCNYGKISRDNEPFILSNELFYFLINFKCMKPEAVESKEHQEQD